MEKDPSLISINVVFKYELHGIFIRMLNVNSLKDEVKTIVRTLSTFPLISAWTLVIIIPSVVP